MGFKSSKLNVTGKFPHLVDNLREFLSLNLLTKHGQDDNLSDSVGLRGLCV